MKRILLVILVLGGLSLLPAGASAAKETELVYADGHEYEMIGATLVTNASPGMLKAPPIYVIGFPVASGTSGPITLPSGYQPQCNPCEHGAFPYHDHVVTGAPGLGTSGTSGGDYKAPWRIVLMLYNPAYENSPGFEPVTSDEDIAAAEAAGEFVPINPGAANPYEIWTQMVLICPIVRKNQS